MVQIEGHDKAFALWSAFQDGCSAAELVLCAKMDMTARLQLQCKQDSHSAKLGVDQAANCMLLDAIGVQPCHIDPHRRCTRRALSGSVIQIQMTKD